MAGRMSMGLVTLKPSRFKIPEERFRLGFRKGNLAVRDYGMGCIVEWLSPVTCQAELNSQQGFENFQLWP